LSCNGGFFFGLPYLASIGNGYLLNKNFHTSLVPVLGPMPTFAWYWTWYMAGIYLVSPQVPSILVLVLPQVIWYNRLVCSSIPSTHTSTIYPSCTLYANATLVTTERGKVINRCHQLKAVPGWGQTELALRNAPPWMDDAWTGWKCFISLSPCSQLTPNSWGFQKCARVCEIEFHPTGGPQRFVGARSHQSWRLNCTTT
jgi:hypothetical protein